MTADADEIFAALEGAITIGDAVGSATPVWSAPPVPTDDAAVPGYLDVVAALILYESFARFEREAATMAERAAIALRTAREFDAEAWGRLILLRTTSLASAGTRIRVATLRLAATLADLSLTSVGEQVLRSIRAEADELRQVAASAVRRAAEILHAVASGASVFSSATLRLEAAISDLQLTMAALGDAAHDRLALLRSGFPEHRRWGAAGAVGLLAIGREYALVSRWLVERTAPGAAHGPADVRSHLRAVDERAAAQLAAFSSVDELVSLDRSGIIF